MTTAATVFGHFPLVLAKGPGAGARNSIGIMLVSGMIIGTAFTLFVVPSIYMLVAKTHVRMQSEDEIALGEPAETAAWCASERSRWKGVGSIASDKNGPIETGLERTALRQVFNIGDHILFRAVPKSYLTNASTKLRSSRGREFQESSQHIAVGGLAVCPNRSCVDSVGSGPVCQIPYTNFTTSGLTVTRAQWPTALWPHSPFAASVERTPS